MFHQVNYSEIVPIMLKPVGAVLENFENSQFFSQSQFSVRKEPDWDFRIKGFLCFACTVQKRLSVQLPHMEFNKGLKHKKNIP